jgi:hypothetical protein
LSITFICYQSICGKTELTHESYEDIVASWLPRGEIKASHLCPRVNLKILGIDFLADLIVLKSWGIDVILGMDWLDKHDGII